MNKLYLYNTTSAHQLKEYINKTYLSNIELIAIEVDNGVILPLSDNQDAGVFYANGKFVKESSELGIFREQEVERYCDTRSEKYVLYDEEVIYIGAFPVTQWGNLFAMEICRLWYYISKCTHQSNIKLAYCGASIYKENTFGFSTKTVYELFDILGIKREQLLDIRTPSKFTKVIVPQKSFKLWEYYTNEYRLIYETLAQNVDLDKEKYDKIYFTRRQLERRKEVGEKAFENLFANNGFKVLAPERLSLKEQIWYLRNCNTLATIEGTLAINILFAKDNINQIILRKQSEILPTFQFLQVRKVNGIYIDVYKEPFKGFPITHDRGPFLMSFNENTKQFAENSLMSFKPTYFNYFIDIFIYSFKCLIYKARHFFKRFYHLRSIWRNYQLSKI
jgi:hypothetical protein